MSFGKFFVTLILGVLAAFLVIKLVVISIAVALGLLMKLVLPIAVIALIVYAVYRATEKKALGGDKRGILP